MVHGKLSQKGQSLFSPLCFSSHGWYEKPEGDKWQWWRLWCQFSKQYVRLESWQQEAFHPFISTPWFWHSTIFHLFVETESVVEMLPACFSTGILYAGLCPQDGASTLFCKIPLSNGLVHDEWQHYWYWPMEEQVNVALFFSGWELLYLTSGSHVFI